ncbi:hypothetical protein C447_12360 [Halococcus hamelinensis 100A6]|uniref:Uncharacterized protein n=1 Tax=Halococcus hamelinensis 100A6 TaxID=1132509 RepID=M0LWB9_9EURY|nr:hypothetical protein C447_12360 [Halococcus hamelinensis 100A6]
MANWTRGARGEGIYMLVWGLLTLAFVPFAGSTVGMALVGIFGLAFCWYGVGMVRTDSRALA